MMLSQTDASTERYMLDTNLFNRAVEGKVSVTPFPPHVQLVATGIQRAELSATRDPEKREKLLAVFREANPEVMPAASFAFGIEGAGWGEAYWNDGSGNYQKMHARLLELEPKRRDPRNQIRDILIAETAIKNGATLVSDDPELRQVVLEFGGRAIDHVQFEHEVHSCQRG